PPNQSLLISTSSWPACKRSNALGKVIIKISLSRAFDVFPHVTQITCGGAPNLSTSSTKSLSFVITTALACLAAWNISGSVASLNPRSRIATALTAKLLLIHVAIAGDICASIQIVMHQAPDDLIYARHIAVQLANLPSQGPAFLPIFVPRSNPLHTSRARQ